jgi:hypothetical protein
MMEDININIQQTQWTQNRIDTKETHTTIDYNQTIEKQKQRESWMQQDGRFTTYKDLS